GSVTFQEFVDASDRAFGMGQTPGVQGPFGGAFADMQQMGVAFTGPFSITKMITVTHQGFGLTGLSAWGRAAPAVEPGSVGPVGESGPRADEDGLLAGAVLLADRGPVRRREEK